MIIFYDSDDLMRKYHLEKLNKYLISNDIDLVFSGTEVFLDFGNYLKFDRIIEPNEFSDGQINNFELYRALFTGNFITLHSVLMKREVVEKNQGFNIDLKYLEDYDFWLRAINNHFKFYYLKDRLTLYRNYNFRRDNTKEFIYNRKDSETEILINCFNKEYINEVILFNRINQIRRRLIRELSTAGYFYDALKNCLIYWKKNKNRFKENLRLVSLIIFIIINSFRFVYIKPYE